MIARTLSTMALFAVASIALHAGPMTTGERQRLIAHFEMTEAWLVSEVEGLSQAQLEFQMTPESWSIREVVEHLAIAEPQYWTNLQDSLKAPVQEGYKAQATDAAILWYGIDRTTRTTTGDARVPRGQFASARESLASFRALRKTMLETAKTSQDDLRGRPLAGGNQDLYQWFLMISSHAQRHILQIREIKAHGSYPKR
jgi:hypothetical protein